MHTQHGLPKQKTYLTALLWVHHRDLGVKSSLPACAGIVHLTSKDLAVQILAVVGEAVLAPGGASIRTG